MPRPPRKSAVPQTRLSRLFRLGLAAGELAVGGVVEGLRRLGEAPSGEAGSIFLTAGAARRLAERLSHLRGAAMKLGQLLSLEGDDLVPPEFAHALSILRAGANQMPLEQVNRVLGREYGRGWEARFETFEYEPVAAASIGQVHRARTTDGRDLALKIQYPGVARSIDSDVENVATLLRMSRLLPAHLDVRGLAAEAKRQLRQEADYIAEAQYLESYRALVADEPGFVVPRVHADFSTRRILAMDFVSGEPLEALAAPEISQAERDEAGARLEHLLFRELYEFRVMQTDPNFANYLYDRATGRIVLLDFGSTSQFSRGFVDRYKRITRAVIAGDMKTMRELATAIGYFRPDDPEETIQAALEAILLVCEPLRHRGRYDFAASDLPSRARAPLFELAFRHGMVPPETIFLHRKLVGSFLLLARIRARVNARKLVLPFLED